MGDGADFEVRDAVDQLIDLLIYAPIGLYLRRDAVLSDAIKLGKSQVKLGKSLLQLAAEGDESQNGFLGLVRATTGLLDEVEHTLTSLGAEIGLAPRTTAAEKPAPQGEARPESETEAQEANQSEMKAKTKPDKAPIEDYDALSVKEVMPLLDEMDEVEINTVKEYEAANKARKTLLAKLESRLAERSNGGS